jgi:hypothetical protein
MERSLEYNTERPFLALPEYGRNVQEMIAHVKTIATKEDRNKAASAIIDVMGALNPHLRDEDDYRHKLWTHLLIMADFDIDVDSPYALPDREVLMEKPEPLNYPKQKIRFGHYGANTENIVKIVANIENVDEREHHKLAMGNFMKKQFLAYASNSVDNHIIASQMKELSNGKLILDNPDELIHTNQVIKTMSGIHINNDPNMKKKSKNKSKQNQQRNTKR